QYASGRLGVELEDDAQCDDLALGAGERPERLPEDRTVLVRELDLRATLGLGRGPRAPPARFLGAEMVEGGAARELAQPRLGGPTLRVEARPASERPLERLGRQVFGCRRVRCHVQQVAVDVVE